MSETKTVAIVRPFKIEREVPSMKVSSASVEAKNVKPHAGMKIAKPLELWFEKYVA